LLVVVPLVRAAARGDLSPGGVESVVGDTTIEDACAFFRAFDHVDVSVRDPPEGMDPLDVRRGSDAVDAVEARSITLEEVMELSAGRDGVAREWTEGFERTFRAAEAIAGGEGPVTDRAAETYLWLLSREPDTFVTTNHGRDTANSVMVRAQEAREGGPDLVEAFAESLVEAGINPGTTADLTAGGLFVALERDGVSV
jgi:triphosphoribosyl-dephospho-CoA synthase